MSLNCVRFTIVKVCLGKFVKLVDRYKSAVLKVALLWASSGVGFGRDIRV